MIDDCTEQSVRIRFTCEAGDILYLNSIFDSYGGLGLMRTLDRKNVNCAYYSTTGVYKTALKILEEMQKEGVKIFDLEVEVTESVDL